MAATKATISISAIGNKGISDCLESWVTPQRLESMNISVGPSVLLNGILKTIRKGKVLMG